MEARHALDMEDMRLWVAMTNICTILGDLELGWGLIIEDGSGEGRELYSAEKVYGLWRFDNQSPTHLP